METLGRSEITRHDSAYVHDELLENDPGSTIDHPELQNVIADIFDNVSRVHLAHAILHGLGPVLLRVLGEVIDDLRRLSVE
jgi:hypothetical protein